MKYQKKINKSVEQFKELTLTVSFVTTVMKWNTSGCFYYEKKGATVMPSSNLDPAVEGRQNDPVQEKNSIQHVTDLWLRESGWKGLKKKKKASVLCEAMTIMT